MNLEFEFSNFYLKTIGMSNVKTLILENWKSNISALEYNWVKRFRVVSQAHKGYLGAKYEKLYDNLFKEKIKAKKFRSNQNKSNNFVTRGVYCWF